MLHLRCCCHTTNCCYSIGHWPLHNHIRLWVLLHRIAVTKTILFMDGYEINTVVILINDVTTISLVFRICCNHLYFLLILIRMRIVRFSWLICFLFCTCQYYKGNLVPCNGGKASLFFSCNCNHFLIQRVILLMAL